MKPTKESLESEMLACEGLRAKVEAREVYTPMGRAGKAWELDELGLWAARIRHQLRQLEAPLVPVPAPVVYLDV